jgi:hypothetical protein
MISFTFIDNFVFHDFGIHKSPKEKLSRMESHFLSTFIDNFTT